MPPVSSRLRKLICACLAGITVGSSAFADPQEILTTLPERFNFSIDEAISIRGTVIEVLRDGRLVLALGNEGSLELLYIRLWAKQVEPMLLIGAFLGRRASCTPMYLGSDAVSASCSALIVRTEEQCEALGRDPRICMRWNASLLQLVGGTGGTHDHCSEEDILNASRTLNLIGNLGHSTQDTCRR